MLHPHFKASKIEIEDSWCLDDVCEAHRVLDALDDYLARASARSK